MGDLRSKRLIILKGFLFLLMGVICVGLLLLEHFNVRTALLLGVAIWSFCRFYYFAFYVIEKYVDGQFKFAGLFSFFVYLVSCKQDSAEVRADSDDVDVK